MLCAGFDRAESSARQYRAAAAENAKLQYRLRMDKITQRRDVDDLNAEIHVLQAENTKMDKKNNKMVNALQAAMKEAQNIVTQQQIVQSTMGNTITSLQGQVLAERKKTVRTPAGIAKAVGLSPNSTEKVEVASSRGVMQTRHLVDATPTVTRCGFLENVVRALKPIILRICQIPKFRNGNTDPAGVCALVLSSIRKDAPRASRTNHRKRKLFATVTQTPPSRSPTVATPHTSALPQTPAKKKKIKFCKDTKRGVGKEEIPASSKGKSEKKEKIKFCKEEKVKSKSFNVRAIPPTATALYKTLFSFWFE